jgi:hypothetical protein
MDPTAAVINNAIFDAVGVRIKTLPITPEKILRALNEKKIKSNRDDNMSDVAYNFPLVRVAGDEDDQNRPHHLTSILSLQRRARKGRMP